LCSLPALRRRAASTEPHCTTQAAGRPAVHAQRTAAASAQRTPRPPERCARAAPAPPGAPLPPPPAAPPPPPPGDAALLKAVETLAAFVARNGPAFEALAVQRNAGDAAFRFLFGGEGAEYYRWRVQVCLRQVWDERSGRDWHRLPWRWSWGCGTCQVFAGTLVCFCWGWKGVP